jgi:hypothetical protein
METEIGSVAQYIEKCLSNPSLGKRSDRIFYRGVRSVYPGNPHKPSIYYSQKRIENEDRMFKEALAFLPELLEQKTTVERLIVMQHHRLPTRILDISRNPLTALFFACFPDSNKDSLGKDGVVYVYKVPEDRIKYCDSDAASVIANLCRMPFDFSVRAIMSLDREDFNKEDEVLQLIHEIGEEKPHFKNVVDKSDINSVVCLRPRMNNPRIIRQDGCFFLFGIDGEKKNPARLPQEWIDARRFSVPSGAKKRLLEELDALNVNEAFVYPDREHISNYIVGKYGADL